MMQRFREAIEFPANPFVALADFVILIVFVLMLSDLRQTILNGKLIERMAVTQAQSQLRQDMSGKGLVSLTENEKQALDQAFEKQTLTQPPAFAVGDLQRFRLEGRAVFRGPDYTRVSPDGADLLHAIGKILAAYQGNLDDPGSGLFKRVAVEGLASARDGAESYQWQVSVDRAQEATRTLMQGTNLSSKVMAVTGRGAWSDTADKPDGPSNQRIEILIAYDGKRTLNYLKNLKSSQPNAARDTKRVSPANSPQ